MSANRALFLGAMHTSGGNLLARLFSVIAALYAATSLTPSGFGEFSFMLSTAGLSSGVGLLGLGAIITREAAQRTERLEVLASAAFILAGVSTLLAAGGVCLIIHAFDFAPTVTGLAGWVAIVSVWSVGLSCNTVLSALLTGRRKFATAAQVTVVRALAVAFAMAVGAFGGSPSATSLYVCLAEALIFVVLFTVLAWRTKPYMRVDVVPVRRGILRLFRVGLRAGAAAILIQTSFWGVQAILIAQPNGTAMLGAFSLAQRIVIVITLIPAGLSAASLPLLSGSGADRPSLRAALVSPVLAAVVATVVVVGATLVGIPILFQQYEPYLFPIIVLTISAVPQSLNAAIGVVAVAKGMITQWVASDVVLAILLLIVGYGAIEPLGLVGLSLSYFVAYSASGLFLVAAVYSAR